jgi:hypothetical protein
MYVYMTDFYQLYTPLNIISTCLRALISYVLLAPIRKVHLRGAAGLQKVKGIKSNKIKKKNNHSLCRTIVYP